MATYVLVKLNRLPTRVFVVLPNSGHVTNEGALAKFVYRRVVRVVYGFITSLRRKEMMIEILNSSSLIVNLSLQSCVG